MGRMRGRMVLFGMLSLSHDIILGRIWRGKMGNNFSHGLTRTSTDWGIGRGQLRQREKGNWNFYSRYTLGFGQDWGQDFADCADLRQGRFCDG